MVNTGTLAYGVSAEFAALATAAAIADPDDLFQRAVFNAYAMMGLDPTDQSVVLNTQQALDAPWLAEYFALRSIQRAMAGKVDVKTGVQDKKWSQAVKQVDSLLADATAAIQSRGYGITEQITLSRLELDFLEPFWRAQ